MPPIIHTSCPICGSADTRQVLSVKDHTVSGELFGINHCNGCQGRFTQNAPDAASISGYYKAESYISHTDTREGMVNRLYHLVRRHTLVGKHRLVEKESAQKAGRLLDLGCGTGAFLDVMKKAGWEVTGLEPEADARRVAKERYGIDVSDSGSLHTLTSGTFDVITLWHVLEHVHDLHSTLDELVRVLKPGGRLFVAVPNFTSGDAMHYGEYWAAWDVPRHLYHFSPNAMRVLLEKHGLSLYDQRRMWYDSFYVSLLSEKYKSGRSSLVRALFEGGLSNAQALMNRSSCSSLIYLAVKSKS
jgi:SAM-dependent methyltransferase